MKETHPELRRVLGFWPVLSVCVGLVVAPSTLLVLLSGFADIGLAFLISMVIGGIIVVLFANTIAELSLAMPRASSFAEYARRATTPGVGIWQGMVFWSTFLGLAAEAGIMGAIVSIFFPAVPLPVWIVIIAAIFFAVNLLGIWVAGWAEMVVTIIFVAVFIIGAIIQMGTGGIGTSFNISSFGQFAAGGWTPILTWSLLAVWLFVGISFPAPLIEEIKKPARTIPMAMFSGLAIIYVLQAVVGPAVIGTMTPNQINDAMPFPIVIAGQTFFGQTGLILFAAAALAAGFGTFNAVMAGTSRVLWELGSDGYLGKFIGFLHPKFKTPWTTLSIIFVIVVVLATVIQDPIYIISITTMMFLVVYLAMHIHLIILRHKEPNLTRPYYAGGPFKFPVLPVLGVIGVIAVWYSQIVSDIRVLYAGGGLAIFFAIISVLVWYLYARKKYSQGKIYRAASEAETNSKTNGL